MDTGEIDVLHDFYLKKFQLSDPELHYDYILFDEGQDASSAMLDVFLKQNATKVIVGDTHQQIYGWRYAVNSLEKADFKSYKLTNSFRFNQNIAKLAGKILEWKDYISEDAPAFPIKGLGKTNQTKSRAILARTNLGLLLKAIEYVTEKQSVENIYFEGNIYSYTYADEGTSLYDVLNLYNKKYHLIRNKLIKQMKKLDDLEDYVSKTEDGQLSMMIEIVKEYGNQIPSIIEEIKEKHIDTDEKEKAEMIFSTVHKSKGMEYDTVQIVNDFICEDDLEKISGKKEGNADAGKINEEINLLYVAMTRAKNSLYIPEDIFPEDFRESSNVHVMKATVLENDELAEISGTQNRKNAKAAKRGHSKPESYSYGEIRKTHKDAYKRWTEELDDELTLMYCDGVNVKDLAKHFGRTKGAIRSRIKKLELKEKYGKIT
jgi:superfamily I DNA/RNA helicase